MTFTAANFIIGNSDIIDTTKTVQFASNLLPLLSESMNAAYDPWSHAVAGDGSSVYASNKYGVTDSVVTSGRAYHQILVDIEASKFYRFSCKIEGLSGTPTTAMISSNAARLGGVGSYIPTGNGRIHMTFQANGDQAGVQFRIGVGVIATETGPVSATISNWMLEEVAGLTTVCSPWFPAGSTVPMRNARACTVTASNAFITDVVGAALTTPAHIMGVLTGDSWCDNLTTTSVPMREFTSYLQDDLRGIFIATNPRPGMGIPEMETGWPELINAVNIASSIAPPTFGILQGGTNDLVDGTSAVKSYFQSFKAQASVNPLFVCTIPPSNKTGASETTRQEVNAWLLSGGLGGVTVIDIATPLQDPSDDSVLLAAYEDTGTNHPSEAGSKIISSIIAGAVQAVLFGGASAISTTGRIVNRIINRF